MKGIEMGVSKAAVTVTSLAFAVLFGGGVYLLMNMNSIAQHMAERIATDTLGVRVSIGSMDISLQDKSVTVSNVRVGNPAGYSGAHSATIEQIHMKAQTLSQALLRFNDISVTGSEVYLEVKQNGTNLTDIKNRVNSKAAAGDKAAQQIKVIIENMRIERMKVNPSILLIGSQKMEPITVPDIVLTGIGVKENGVLAREAIAQIWTSISKNVSKQANEAGFYEGISPEGFKELGVGRVEEIKENIQRNVNELSKDLKYMFDD